MQIDWADFGFALPGVRAPSQRLRRRPVLLAVPLYRVHAQPVHGHLPAVHGPLPEVLRGQHGRRHLRQHEDGRPLAHRRTRPCSTRGSSSTPALEAASPCVACNVRRGNEKGRVERPIGFVRRRFWPGRRFRDLFDLNAQAAAWRDDFANGRVHEETGKVPVSRLPSRGETPAQAAVRHSLRHRRCRGHRRHQDVPRHLRSQQVLRTLEARLPERGRARQRRHGRRLPRHQAGRHPPRARGASARTSSTPRTSRVCSSRSRAPPPARCRPRSRRSTTRAAPTSSCSPRAAARSIARPCGSPSSSSCSAPPPPQSAVAEVMQTGHVGAEYVEYVLRHKRGLAPQPPPLRLGNDELDRHLAARARPVHLRPARPRRR